MQRFHQEKHPYPTQPTQHRNLQDGLHGRNQKFTRLLVSPSTLLSSQSRCLSTSLFFRSPLPTPPPPPSPPIWLGWPSWPIRSTLKCREVERRWVRINLKWSLHHPSAHLGTRPLQVVADRLIIKTVSYKGLCAHVALQRASANSLLPTLDIAVNIMARGAYGYPLRTHPSIHRYQNSYEQPQHERRKSVSLLLVTCFPFVVAPTCLNLTVCHHHFSKVLEPVTNKIPR